MTEIDVAARGEGRSRVFSLEGALAIVLAYSAVHFLARMAASPNLGEDDPWDNVFTQVLQLGYDPSQPPLYDWALWLVQAITGPTLVSFLALKYTLLIAIAGFLYASARRVLGDPVWALISVETIPLMYQMSWRFHEGFTHAVGATLAVCATLWAVLRVIDRATLRDHVLLGGVVGLGLLTEYKYAVAPLALLAAACLQPAVRQRLRPVLLALSLALAALIAAPFYAWLLGEHGLKATLGLHDLAAGNVSAVVSAPGVLLDVAWRPLYCLLPLTVLLALAFPRMLVEVRRLSWRPGRSEPDLVLLLGHYCLIVWALLFVAALALGLTNYPSHRLAPLLLIAVIWPVHLARKACRSPRQVRRFGYITATVVAIAFIARALNMFVYEPFCDVCRWGVPYEDLAGAMRQAGYQGGTIIAPQFELAGNLRWLFPGARIATTERPAFAPPPRPGAGEAPAIVIWREGFPGGYALVKAQRYLAPRDRGRVFTVHKLTIPWHHLWRPTGYRRTTWYVAVMTEKGTPARQARAPTATRSR